jgi:hypothetical protein
MGLKPCRRAGSMLSSAGLERSSPSSARSLRPWEFTGSSRARAPPRPPPSTFESRIRTSSRLQPGCVPLVSPGRRAARPHHSPSRAGGGGRARGRAGVRDVLTPERVHGPGRPDGAALRPVPVGTPGVGGLIRREFRSGTPYAGEDLLLSPPDGRAFAARCYKAAVAAKMKAACIAEFRANELDVQIRFAPGALPHWEALAQALRRFIAAGSAEAGPGA